MVSETGWKTKIKLNYGRLMHDFICRITMTISGSCQKNGHWRPDNRKRRCRDSWKNLLALETALVKEWFGPDVKILTKKIFWPRKGIWEDPTRIILSGNKQLLWTLNSEIQGMKISGRLPGTGGFWSMAMKAPKHLSGTSTAISCKVEWKWQKAETDIYRGELQGDLIPMRLFQKEIGGRLQKWVSMRVLHVRTARGQRA